MDWRIFISFAHELKWLLERALLKANYIMSTQFLLHQCINGLPSN